MAAKTTNAKITREGPISPEEIEKQGIKFQVP